MITEEEEIKIYGEDPDWDFLIYPEDIPKAKMGIKEKLASYRKRIEELLTRLLSCKAIK